MRVLLGLAALAASVNAQTVATDSATGSWSVLSTSVFPTARFNLFSDAAATVTANQYVNAVTAPNIAFQANTELSQTANWGITLPNAIKTLVFQVATNTVTAQLMFRYSGTTYNGLVNTFKAQSALAWASSTSTTSFICDPCTGGTGFASCSPAGPAANGTPSNGYQCASLTRRYTYTAFTTATNPNNFAIQIFDRPFTGSSAISTTFAFVITVQPPPILGDPQISGMQGQDFQVHGVPDEVFNMITYPNLQVNARFVYLSSAACVDNYTACFAHPGTYISEEGIRLGSDKIHVRAGSAKKGLTVSVNGQKVVAAKTTVKLGSVEVVNHRRVVIKTPIMAITVTNSDNFLNQETQLYDRKLLALGAERRVLSDSEKFHPEVPLHGLQGQTWRNVEYPSGLDYEGSISDYQVQDGNLFGTNFVFNQFSQ